MITKNVPTKADVELGDSLTEKIRNSVLGVENLRTDNCRLTDQIESLERTNLQLESEVQSIKLTLEQERAERRHYHSLANEIITRLDVVGQIIDEVVKRAEQETYRQRKENPRVELPDLKVPSFLQKVEGALNGGAKPE